MELIVDNGLMKAEYDEDTKIGYCYYNGLYHLSKHISGYRALMDFTKEKNIHALFHNGLHLKGTFSEANNFIKNDWVPWMEEYGLLYGAMALTTDVFTRFAMNKFLAMGKTKAEVRIFKSSRDAQIWLETKLGYEISVPEFYMK